MKRSTVVLTLTTSFVALGMVAWFLPEESDAMKRKSGPVAVVGNPQKVKRAYERWRNEFEATTAPRIDVGLAWSRGMSTEYSRMRGQAAFHLDSGTVSVELHYAPEGGCFDVWLTSRTPQSTNVGIEPADRFTLLGTVTGGGSEASSLETNLSRISKDVLELDLMVVTHSGKTPLDEVLLVGMPTLFQRVWTRERAGDSAPTASSNGMSLALIVQSFTPPSSPDFAELVAQGEQLFFEAQFEGNGRTCGTCHPAENNLTVDVPFIEALAANDPGNALFVAEFDPNLMPDFNDGKMFENPALMHEQGLILENVDGFDDLQTRFVMRATSHVFAQGVSITRPESGMQPPEQRTGWAGDGAPGGGTLREFSIGAVTQHFTKTFERQDGVDFILPDDGQLDALEAFQLSLGRQEDPDLFSLTFLDSDAQSALPMFQASCDRCHTNGGANSQFNSEGIDIQSNEEFANGNFNTGVEPRLQNLIGGPSPERPVDGGFGVDQNEEGAFGDGNFNTQSIIEAADTVPSFHNNLTGVAGAYSNTIEDAISFYLSDEFAASTGAVMAVPLDGGELGSDPPEVRVMKLGRLLRSLNAMENARSASSFALRAKELGDEGADEFFISRALQVAFADCTDGSEVQSEVDLNPDSVDHFNQALQLIQEAQNVDLGWDERKDLIDLALEQLDLAKTSIAN